MCYNNQLVCKLISDIMKIYDNVFHATMRKWICTKVVNSNIVTIDDRRLWKNNTKRRFLIQVISATALATTRYSASIDDYAIVTSLLDLSLDIVTNQWWKWDL